MGAKGDVGVDSQVAIGQWHPFKFAEGVRRNGRVSCTYSSQDPASAPTNLAIEGLAACAARYCSARAFKYDGQVPCTVCRPHRRTTSRTQLCANLPRPFKSDGPASCTDCRLRHVHLWRHFDEEFEGSRRIAFECDGHIFILVPRGLSSQLHGRLMFPVVATAVED